MFLLFMANCIDSLFARVLLTKIIITDNTEIDLPDQSNGKAFFHLLQVCHPFLYYYVNFMCITCVLTV